MLGCGPRASQSDGSRSWGHLPISQGWVARHEKRVNGGSWESIGSSSYSLDGTTLTVDFGSVNAGDKIEVRANGSKVSTYQAEITVISPTVEGSDTDLETEIKVESWGTGSWLGVSGTEDGSRLHYVFNASWSAAEYVIDEANGDQHLYLPNVNAGDTATVGTIPVAANPSTGEVKIAVDDSSDANPVLDVKEGANSGDSVEYVYYATVSGTKYVLYSQSREVVLDTDTAESPVYFEDDDSDSILEIFDESSGDSSSSGGSLSSSGGGLLGPIPWTLLGALVGLGGLALLADRVFNSELMILGVVGAGAVIAVLVTTTIASPFSTVLLIFEPIGEGLGQVAELAGMVALGLGGWFVYTNYIKG